MSTRRRVLLLLKPFDVYPPRARAAAPSSPPLARPANPQVRKYLDDRCKVHRGAIDSCQGVLRRKPVDWEVIMRDELSRPISHVDLVVTVGGDGTLLRVSHFMDGSVPVVGVNSDPTKAEEVEEFNNEFDATRSTGYLCAATAENFEQVLDEILEGHRIPSELSRISITLNGVPLANPLNDVLIAHPCPATVSRFSFRIRRDKEWIAPLVNCRSSGLRVSTAAGSTAAMLSAGGFTMPIASRDLQYMVREPILSKPGNPQPMHGLLKPEQSMQLMWYSKEGIVYIDGSHVFHPIQHGDAIEISSKAPTLKVYLPSHLLK
ncbi:putative NADH kinase [Acorus calamus]|uniref:NADH kinase n=2 Tax=Acorus calamus TaxID=4465 RepID=A0AAV9CWL9_ACOCL|nr:putative NADH kinase [Acorus calamus]